jgi:hypothetical protein
MKSWLASLRTPPEPLTALQGRTLIALTIMVAATRFMALACSLWDWDEALFSHALRDYDVAAHHPHPPGFPLFVLFAKAVHLVVASEFRSVQTVTMAGALALFPLMVYFTRELRMRLTTGVIAALLLVFSPNVWLFGGSAFSDVPSLALALLALALLLRGCRSGKAYLLGALVLAIAAGFRPQNLMVGLVPALLASWYRVRAARSPKPLLLAILIGGVVVAGSYAGAARATGEWEVYRDAVRYHQEYIRKVDSFQNPLRRPLPFAFDDFFLRPYRMERLNVALSVLAALGVLAALAGRRPAVLAVLMIFGPFSVVGWLMLDILSASRFAIAWTPMIAIAAAEGAALAAELLSRLHRRAWVVEIAVAVFLIGTMITWTAPALRVVRRTKSPPVQAVEWVRANLPPSTLLYIQGGMGPHADLLLADYPRQYVDEDPFAPADGRKPWIVREGPATGWRAENFKYERGRLWQMVRQRYFEASVMPVAAKVAFGDGWYGEESDRGGIWRWMSGRGTLRLQAFSKPGVLRLHAYAPLDAIAPPTVTVTFNGVVIDRFVAGEPLFTRSYTVASRPAGWNDLLIETSETINPAKRGAGGDPRDLGLRLDGVEWSAAE